MAGDEICIWGDLICHRSDSPGNKIMSFLIFGIEKLVYLGFVSIVVVGILYVMFAIGMLFLKFHGWLIS